MRGQEITDGPRRVYCGINYTGSSCEDIYNGNPEAMISQDIIVPVIANGPIVT